MGNFYYKYLKYKNKYSNLKNLIGGGRQSAQDMFLAAINRNYEVVLPILINDRNKGLLRFEGIPTKEQIDVFTNIFNQIFLINNSDTKTIDFIIKSYINNNFGNPSSLENLGRFKNSFKKYNLLKVNIETPLPPITAIEGGLIGLENFLDLPDNSFSGTFSKFYVINTMCDKNFFFV